MLVIKFILKVNPKNNVYNIVLCVIILFSFGLSFCIYTENGYY